MDDKFDPANVVYRFTPCDEDRAKLHDDVAEEYVIERVDDACSGLIVYAKYHGHWIANPHSTRPVIKHLLEELGKLRSAQEPSP